MDQQTLAIHHGYEKDTQKTMAVPIYQTTAFDFESAEFAAETFALQHGAQNVYSRIGNPTNDILEQRFAVLEGGTGALSLASGMAATFYSIINVANAGDNILAAEKLYGGTVTLFSHTLKRLGIEVRSFDQHNPDKLESLIDDKTKAIFIETITNPSIDIPDFNRITSVAKKHRIVTIADNTVATPILCKPLELGVDVVVHSLSKYATGQGLTIGGIIVDGKQCGDTLIDNPRYPNFNEPDDAYHGLVYTEAVKDIAFSFRARMSLLRDTGSPLTPFSAWLVIQGMETLSLRIKEHSKNAQAVAEFLESHQEVKSVNYPGLKTDPNYELAQKYFNNGCSGLLSFEVASFDKAKKILNDTKLFSVVANIGDTKSIINHSASTTHQQLSAEELEAAGVKEGLVRLSVGIEAAADLIADLKQAIES
ncbi:MAG: O-acetylhomoserine aminocarboxypropyltransferase/cysteine synthase [Proteobacteria bacterium]|nr:O-acetylhomoserine aminocarboxypropyltransferase/cysteine synthase [Pseudomonadota bacterium]